jgi:hypothetical protein
MDRVTDISGHLGPRLQGALKTATEMLARNDGLITNPSTLRNIPEERRSHTAAKV